MFWHQQEKRRVGELFERGRLGFAIDRELYCRGFRAMRVLKLLGLLAGVIAVGVLVLWWVGRPPARPANVPANGIYIETGIVPFKLRSTPGT